MKYDDIATQSFIQGFKDIIKQAASSGQYWIQKALNGDKGKLHRELNIPEGQDIPKQVLRQAAQSTTKGGKTDKLARRARLALTLEKLHKR